MLEYCTPFFEKNHVRITTLGDKGGGKTTLTSYLLSEFEQYDTSFKGNTNNHADSVECLKNSKVSSHVNRLYANEEKVMLEKDVEGDTFSSLYRTFLNIQIPDEPEYYKTMIAGISNCDVAIILLDGKAKNISKGKQYIFLASILQVPHIIVVINKMDLLQYSKETFTFLVEEFSQFIVKLDIHDVTYIPISALHGDNISKRSETMPWYSGNTLQYVLENVSVNSNTNLLDFRFPVHNVVHSKPSLIGYAGHVLSGTVRVGEDVAILPSGELSQIQTITVGETHVKECCAGQSVLLTLKNSVQVKCGDMIVRKDNLPHVSSTFDATVCWLDTSPGRISNSGQYLLQHTTRLIDSSITRIYYSINRENLHRQICNLLDFQDIGRVSIETYEPIMFDTFKKNHYTGNFNLLDPRSNTVIAIGVIRGLQRKVSDVAQIQHATHKKSPNVNWEKEFIERRHWEEKNGHQACVLWFTGLSGAGKSTIARLVSANLFNKGCQVMLLDGDNVRHGLCGDLGFSSRDRSENIRRVAETARLFFEQGNIVVCTFISPFIADRQFVRSLFPEKQFFEVFIKCPIKVCERRDPKGLYKKALTGQIKDFTGITSPYEEPQIPEIIIETDKLALEASVEQIVKRLPI